MILFGKKSEDLSLRLERRKLFLKYRPLYFFLIIPFGLLFIFNYIPMYGVIIAFKDFSLGAGTWGSPWNNFQHFKDFFDDALVGRAFFNTIKISVLRIIFGFPAPIIFALLLNEIMYEKYKKLVQSISYMPSFISWVILSGIFFNILSVENGVINTIIVKLGGEPVSFLTEPVSFIVILISTGLWQGVGAGAIIYLASIASIDQGLYESAVIDGATRLQKALYITLPGIMPIITISAIMTPGSILSAGFDQIFNLYNPLVYNVADITVYDIHYKFSFKLHA